MCWLIQQQIGGSNLTGGVSSSLPSGINMDSLAQLIQAAHRLEKIILPETSSANFRDATCNQVVRGVLARSAVWTRESTTPANFSR